MASSSVIGNFDTGLLPTELSLWLERETKTDLIITSANVNGPTISHKKLKARPKKKNLNINK